MMAANAQQQISVTDLDIPQLADVRRQLDEVCSRLTCRPLSPQLIGTAGVDTPHQLVHSVETGSGEVQVVYRQCSRSEDG